MTDYQRIYRERAHDYHQLVSAEDARGEVDRWLTSALTGALPVRGERDRPGVALDVGAGTGRVAAMVARAFPHAQVVCCDGAAPMLAELQARWRQGDGVGPRAAVADYRALPFADGSFAAVTAGWALGHLTGFFPGTWRADAQRALAELERVVRRGGAMAILETLGTGADVPAPPRPELGELYATFEARGFTRTVLRTDYRFRTRAEAERLVGFFFGAGLVDRLRDDGEATTLIEWTGAWQRRA